MTQIASSQIAQYLAAPIWISAVSVTSTSYNATSVITTALNTAGNGGVSVPLQVSSSNTTLGVIATGTYSQTTIRSSSNKNEITDSAGNQVYGKISFATSTYTLSFYSNFSGVETAYSFASSTSIDFTVNYVFDFYRLPYSFALGSQNLITDQLLYQIPVTTRQQLTISTNNTVPNLSYTPLYGVIFIVNGISYPTTSSSPAFSVSSQTVTFSSGNAGFNLQAGWDVVAVYERY